MWEGNVRRDPRHEYGGVFLVSLVLMATFLVSVVGFTLLVSSDRATAISLEQAAMEADFAAQAGWAEACAKLVQSSAWFGTIPRTNLGDCQYDAVVSAAVSGIVQVQANGYCHGARRGLHIRYNTTTNTVAGWAEGPPQ